MGLNASFSECAGHEFASHNVKAWPQSFDEQKMALAEPMSLNKSCVYDL